MRGPRPDVLLLALPPIVGVVGVAVGSPLVAITGSLVAALALAEHRRRRRWRRSQAEAESLPVAIDHLIQQLNAGASLGQACRSLGSTSGPLRPLVAALVGGGTVGEAVEALDGDDDPSVRLVATTLGLLAANGGPAVPSLRRLRHTLVGRAHRRRRARAVAAGATSSAGLLAVAPAGFALVLSLVEPALADFYVSRVAGATCATASVTLSAVGWWWMQATVVAAVGRGA